MQNVIWNHNNDFFSHSVKNSLVCLTLKIDLLPNAWFVISCIGYLGGRKRNWFMEIHRSPNVDRLCYKISRTLICQYPSQSHREPLGINWEAVALPYIRCLTQGFQNSNFPLPILSLAIKTTSYSPWSNRPISSIFEKISAKYPVWIGIVCLSGVLFK